LSEGAETERKTNSKHRKTTKQKTKKCKKKGTFNDKRKTQVKNINKN